eukprot:scaffold2761_cov73-Skeletonema_marinoi.AAC.1
MAELPTNAEIRSKMESLLRTVNLDIMTTTQFIAALSDEFDGADLSSRKKFILGARDEILDVIMGSDDSSSITKKQVILSMRWEKAAAAVQEGRHKEALRLYHSLLADSPQSDTSMINDAIEGVIDEIYGPKG